MVAITTGVLISQTLAWILLVLALVVLALDLASARWVQEFVPALGRLPLVQDHDLQRQPALPRSEAPVLDPPADATDVEWRTGAVVRPSRHTSRDVANAEQRLRAALSRKIREGRELFDEAMTLAQPDKFLSRVPDRTIRLAILPASEKKWTEAVEDLLIEHPRAAEFSDAVGLPHDEPAYMIANRVKARLKVLREIRGAL